MTIEQQNLWASLDKLFEKSEPSFWLANIRQMIDAPIRLDEFTRSAKTLAELHLSNSKDPQKKKAAGYALLAAMGYIKMGRMAPAIAINDWLKTITSAQLVRGLLESEISKAFSEAQTTKSKIAEIETHEQPAGFQEDLHKAFRDENPKEHPKGTYPLFSELPEKEVIEVIRRASVRSLKDQEVLFSEGEKPDAFYLVSEGEFILESPLGFQRSFKEGDFFGELGVVGNMNRTATIRSKGNSAVIVFPKPLLVDCFVQFPDLEQKLLRFFYLRLFFNMAKRDEQLQDMNEKQLLDFFYTFTTHFLKSGRTLFRAGDFSDAFFYLIAGEWMIEKSDGNVIRQGPGNWVGETGFLLKKPRNATVTALTDVHYLRCDELMFKNFSRSFPHIGKFLEALAARRRDPLLDDPARFIV